jgi:hypothetical protein
MTYIPLATLNGKVDDVKAVTSVIPNAGAMTSIAQDGTVMKAVSYVAPDNATITTINNKTTNLPASPAAVGSAMTLTAAYDAAKTALQATDVAVPSTNSSANSHERDVVGSKLDDEGGNSIYSKLYILERHFHSPAKVYPTLANEVTVSKDVAAAWGITSTIVQIIPANTVTVPFDIHYINLGVISNNDAYELILYKGAALSEVEIGRVSFDRSTTTTEGSIPIQTELLPANTRVSARLTSGSGNTRSCGIKLHYHEY